MKTKKTKIFVCFGLTTGILKFIYVNILFKKTTVIKVRFGLSFILKHR